MTTRQLPFLLRFGERIPRQAPPPITYDSSRQVSRALIDGRWVDAVDCSGHVIGGWTKKTGVDQETTDDD